ncbi:putative peroxisome biosynthesis protein (PAS1/Peroxin-1) [Talaromyces proteolyticus]|uniref:Peroxisomal ATPase PEX1 n=1 Tax=Talaromyces proteolyticus TaxID=1131652 RepID=A0AAD4Q1B3_9EURO|nr:putative peroxisome biosynthesis protein (PAS1/Peroxin-1) [Talaromyces proteolyticus]KAH8698310.1 putative peroxisome biosynthesis protein (PAS1/Peroxin-1) [Talaromyces proteolyticus]
MAPSKKSSTTAEVVLVPLKTCLVNLPTSVVSLLVNANAAAQNVIVELQYRSSSSQTSASRSSYLGWTGMPSKRKVAPMVSRDGISAGSSAREQEVAVVEIDSTFGRVLGLNEGQKVGLFLHLDPPVAHTINIEPSTPADWEIIELHASFLELNLLHQIRALPNPNYTGASSTPADHLHPLTLHLSPTSTANIIVTALSPTPPATSPFAKIAPDAEVIVAPKVRPKSGKANRGENRSTTSNGRKSVGARSTSSTVRPKSREAEPDQPAVYLRGVDRQYAEEWFDGNTESHANSGFKIWVDRNLLATNKLRGHEWVVVSIVQPAGLQAPLDPQQQLHQKEQESAEVGRPSAKLVAKVLPWDDAPDSRHIALSSMLCTALSSPGIVGGVVKVEAAPSQLARSAVKSIKIYPFASDLTKKKDGLKFGGDTAASRSALAERIKITYGSPGAESGFMSGPLTDGMVLPAADSQFPAAVFDGAIVRFDPPIKSSESTTSLGWILGSESKLSIDVQAEVPRPVDITLSGFPTDEQIPSSRPEMVGIDSLINKSLTNLSRASSILLTGGLGSGKTTLCHLLAHRLREEYLFNVTYFSCRKLVTDETRVSTIKETLSRLFMSASWCTRLGGRALVILDDIDKICPVETELQVGGENGRSRQVSELICSIVREHCTMTSSVILLATAQSKESLNNVVVGGHVVREITSLKAPDKEGRRKVLEKLTSQDKDLKMLNGHSRNESGPTQESWLDPSNPGSRPSSSGADGFILSRDLDFLDLAGKTDGYMPGDLVLLVSRARNEALIRSVHDSSTESTKITLMTDDFDRALKGFTPASLRNVTLTSSSTTFSSIGGLHSTRQTLMETLQYPTKYAPIFSQCPLRLRSGLLLYGFPGCGKTLLASAVAGECGLNFISVKGPEILNKYIGASEKSVRDLFERAEAARPCILFFDEFDSIAPKRGHDSTGVTDRVVNQLLTQMDGAEGLSGVYVLAATSRPDLIDPALLRPGRLDKSLLCDMPSHDDRIDIIQAVSKKLKLSAEVESRVGEIASRTGGYSGADIQAVVYNAHLEAIHDLLGDRASTTAASATKKSSGAQAINGSDTANNKSFIQFLYSNEQGDDSSTVRTKLPPPAVVAAKLEALKQARRRQRQLEHGTQQDSEAHQQQQQQPNGTSAEDTGDEVIIGWQHIERSLATTRSSLSDRERRRLEAIYREFVVGRNGEMPDGEGAREIGGRTSLM